ncbi:hypothetical protein ACI78V_09370 [Geodermatophilus sp. SYSU D00742]
MLLAQLQFGEWVLRRVETIAFQDERNVARKMTVNLRVRDDAPVFVDDSNVEYWLLPLTLMRRRTLVDFHVQTEDGQPVTMPGLRLAQQLDQAVLLAAAATAAREPAAVAGDDAAIVTSFIQELVVGRREEVRRCWERFRRVDPAGEGALEALRASTVFSPPPGSCATPSRSTPFCPSRPVGTGSSTCPSSSRSAGSTSARN